MSKSYHEQFRVQKQNGFNGNSKLKPIGKSSSSRVTVVKRPSLRSDTFLLMAKPNETTIRVRKDNPTKIVSRRLPVIKVPVRGTSIAPETRRVQVINRNSVVRSIPKYVNSSTLRRDLEHKPVYVTKRHNSAYYPSTRPVYYRESGTLSVDDSDIPRRVRIANNGYVVRRRRPSIEYIYDDYPTESPIEKTRSQRVVRVLRDTPQRDDGFYHIEASPIHRRPLLRRSASTDYIQVEKAPTHIRHRRVSRPEILYLDEDDREVNFVTESHPSSRYVQYIYGDDKDKRSSRDTQVIYIDDKATRTVQEPQVIYIDEKEKRRSHESDLIYLETKDKRYSHEPQVIYVDDKEKRRSHESDVIYLENKGERHAHGSEIIYVDNQPAINQGHYTMAYQQPLSTRIVYQ